MTSEQVAQAYSALAQPYIELFGSVDGAHPDDVGVIERHLGGLDGPVLDLGCGPGHWSGLLAARGVDVTGIDLVPEFVDHARRTHPGVRFELGSLADLARPQGSVAGVLAWYSLIHLDPAELDGVLAGIGRVLAPGGVLVVGFFTGAVCEPFDHRVVEAHRWPVDELSHRLSRAGLEEVERTSRPGEREGRTFAALAARRTPPAAS